MNLKKWIQINGYLWNSEPLRFSINEKSNIISSDDFDKILELRFTNKEVKGAIEIKKTGEKLVIEMVNIPMKQYHFLM